MKRMTVWKGMLVLCLLLALPMAALAQGILSTDDLEKGLKNPKLVLVDIRKVEEYKAGHIPGAIGIFYNNWAPGKGGMRNELPPAADLKDLLAANGIAPESAVVVYGKTATASDRADVTRVAWTLKYAGVKSVSVLNGGFEKWQAEKKAVSAEAVKPNKAKAYRGSFKPAVVATKQQIAANQGKALIVDAREIAFYEGKQKLPFENRAGRIPGAANLPTAQVFVKNPDREGPAQYWTYKDLTALKAMAEPVVGADRNREIITYCDTGKVASVWWFILSEGLGYKNVKNYDGSMEEWANDPKMPMEPAPAKPAEPKKP